MMLRALVLLRRDSGENDRRLTLLTEERGLVEVIAKGARKGGSRLAGCSEPLAVCEIEVAKGKAREFMVQAQPITSFPGLREDYDRLSAALAFAELIASTTPHERPELDLFPFTLVALKSIELHEKPLVALAWCELKLLAIVGHLPSFDACVETGLPIQEAAPLFSPSGGGYVVASAGQSLPDRIRTTPEVLIGLAKLAELEEPPRNFKRVEDSLKLLHQVWREIAGRPLPAHEAVIRNGTPNSPSSFQRGGE